MNTTLFHVVTGERRRLIGLTDGQLATLRVHRQASDQTEQLLAGLDKIGYLPVWEYKLIFQAALGWVHAEPVKPALLFAVAVDRINGFGGVSVGRAA